MLVFNMSIYIDMGNSMYMDIEDEDTGMNTCIDRAVDMGKDIL